MKDKGGEERCIHYYTTKVHSIFYWARFVHHRRWDHAPFLTYSSIISGCAAVVNREGAIELKNQVSGWTFHAIASENDNQELPDWFERLRLTEDAQKALDRHLRVIHYHLDSLN